MIKNIKKLEKKLENLDKDLKDYIISNIKDVITLKCDSCDYVWKSDKFEEICPKCKNKFISLILEKPYKKIEYIMLYDPYEL